MGSRGRDPEYTDEEVLRAVAVVMVQYKGMKSSRNDYEESGVKPSYNTVRNRFDSWTKAKEIAKENYI